MSEHTQATPATLTVDTLPVIAHQGLRVVTTGLLAQLYGAEAKNIRMNFANNANRFEPGKHYVKLEGDDLRDFKHQANQIGLVARNAAHLILWTERGAARHAKMLDTDQAWEVFEHLEDAYFRADPGKNAAGGSAIPALPTPEPPADPITPEVRHAIERRVQSTILRHYDRLRDDITAAVRLHAERFPEDRNLVRYVQNVEVPDNALVMLHAADLWALTSRVSLLPAILNDALEAVQHIEAATGRQWSR